MISILLILTGGAGGAVARFGCQQMIAKWTNWPGWVAICLINIIGSFLIGLAVCILTGGIKDLALHHLTLANYNFRELLFSELLSLLVVGFCGSFTTFSTYSLDNFFLSVDKKKNLLFNMAATPLLAFVAVLLGWCCGEVIMR